MAARIPVPTRRPEAWAYALVSAVALVALGDGILLVVQAGGVGTKGAAGWFVGGVGLALAVLLVLAIREDVRGGRESVVTELANVIVSEEEGAGRDVEERFQTELPPLPVHEALRNLVITGALIVAWMLALPWVGFGLVTTLVCAGFIVLVARRRWWVALVAGVAIGGGLALIFSLAGVLLPTGALWHLVGRG